VNDDRDPEQELAESREVLHAMVDWLTLYQVRLLISFVEELTS